MAVVGRGGGGGGGPPPPPPPPIGGYEQRWSDWEQRRLERTWLDTMLDSKWETLTLIYGRHVYIY
jgi:hypothetical protein